MTFPQPQGRRFLIRLKKQDPGRTRSSVSWRVLGMSHLLRLLDELVREMCCVGVEGASSDTHVVGCRGEGGGRGEGSASVSQFGFDVSCSSLAGRARQL